jgi:glucose/arabinose dehydrogenase
MLFAAACQLCADDQNGTSPPLGPSPDDVLTSFQHDPAVRVELAAAEPVVVDPVALCFDEAGRLFVAEMGDYPVGPGDDPQAVSRIKLLSDTDGDGHYESAQVFADNLSFVTGLTPWQNGLVVTLAGEVCWLADTDGDGQADTRESWFQGFTEENTQLRANLTACGAATCWPSIHAGRPKPTRRRSRSAAATSASIPLAVHSLQAQAALKP